MKISDFVFIVTDACNFQCSYCPQKKERKFINSELIKETANFIYTFLSDAPVIGFYGGEPLLCFNKMRDTVSYLEQLNRSEKNFRFSITTNGSLLDKKKLEFLHQKRFSVILSFDGYANDISRKRGDFERMVSNIREIEKYSHIMLKINSVFIPETVERLSESLRLFYELGIKDIRFTLSTIEEWKADKLDIFEMELLKTIDWLVSTYNETGTSPVRDFQPGGNKSSLFACNAGKDRMAVTPDGKLWGCYAFHDYFKGREETEEFSKYCFGVLDDFIDRHETIYPQILSNYAGLRMDNFQCGDSYCFVCGDIFNCRVCPVNAAYISSFLGEIPGWICSINRIKKKARDKFQRSIEERGNG
jgi:sulfatase maturation enzyme AslB (radical SAM superfamily)